MSQPVRPLPPSSTEEPPAFSTLEEFLAWQASIWGTPETWTAEDRADIEAVQQTLTALTEERGQARQ